LHGRNQVNGSLLTWDECEYASIVGMKRQVDNLRDGRWPGPGRDVGQQLSSHMTGAIAEYAFALEHDLCWRPLLENPCGTSDFGNVEIKSTWRPDGNLIWPEAQLQKLHKPIVVILCLLSVDGEGRGIQMQTVGWAKGSDFLARDTIPNKAGPFRLIPREELKPVGDLLLSSAWGAQQ
jgi:hypothetical protein